MKKLKIKICMGSSCFSRGNNKSVEIIEKFIEDNKSKVEIELFGSLCMDKCSKGPIVIIEEKEYTNVSPDSILDLLRYHLEAKNA